MLHYVTQATLNLRGSAQNPVIPCTIEELHYETAFQLQIFANIGITIFF